MADSTDVVATIVADCERYWRRTRVPQAAIEEMTAELERHLRDAEAANKRPETVIGNDLTGFAESWASAYRMPPSSPSRVESTYKPRKLNWRVAAAWIGGLVIATALIGTFAPKEEDMNEAVWIGIWLGLMILFGIGEMLTAGFFLLPFAIGAAVAAILAVVGVSVPIQMLVFIVVSIVALWAFQRFAKSDKEPLYPVGVKRYEGALAMVLEDIDVANATGIVRMENEEWRATTEWDWVIPAGTTVRVVEVRGTRLVVEPAGPDHQQGFDQG